MRFAQRRSRATRGGAVIGLGAAGAAVACALALGSRPPASEHAPRATLPLSVPADAVGDPLSRGRPEEMERQVQVILRRPIFRPDRRATLEPAHAIASSPAKIRLSGVLMAPGDKVATFETAASAEQAMAREGAYIAGYRIQAIQRDRVVVIGPEGRRIWRPSVRDPAPAPRIVAARDPAATRSTPDAPAMPASSPIFGGAFHAALRATR